MFPPDADRSPYDGPTSLPRGAREKIPKIINHANTRLPEQSNEDGNVGLDVPTSPTRSRIGAAIAGEPCKSKFHIIPA